MSTRAIEVRIWGQAVGAAALDPETGYYAFQYTPAWRRSGVELAPLMMPLNSRQEVFVFPSLPDSYKKLPALLSDALPDDFGNALIDAWMATHGVDKKSITPLDRLAYMGKRGMGALEFSPARGTQRESAQPLAMQKLVAVARNVLHGRLTGDAHVQAAIANIIKVGTSAGGARAKAVVAWNPQTDELRSGQFDVAPGFEHWLLKFDGVGADRQLGNSGGYGRIEYAYFLMALAAGIDMSPCRLLEENGRAHFMTRRFDRDGNVKHHLQSLCAMAHLDYQQLATHAYEQLFLTIDQIGLPAAAAAQTFRRMAFNVMARNCDDHVKNFGFILRQGQSWQLAPAYDVIHAHNPDGYWNPQHLMSVNGKFDEITRADLLTVAARFSIPNAGRVLDEVAAAVRRWTEFASQAALPEARVREVEKDFAIV